MSIIVSVLMFPFSLYGEKNVIIPAKCEQKVKGWGKNAKISLSDSGETKIHLTGEKWSGASIDFVNYSTKNPKVVTSLDYKSFIMRFKITEGIEEAQVLKVSFTDIEKGTSNILAVKEFIGGSLSVGEELTMVIPMPDITKGAEKMKSEHMGKFLISAYKSSGEKNIQITLFEAYFTND